MGGAGIDFLDDWCFEEPNEGTVVVVIVLAMALFIPLRTPQTLFDSQHFMWRASEAGQKA